MDSNDLKLFYNYLNKSKIYYEYGSGGSTYQASIRSNIKKIYSVESDQKWQKILKTKILKNNVNYIFNKMNTAPNSRGYPGKNATNIQKIKYSNRIKKLNKRQQRAIDMILIDGRFRVACCLKCYNVIKNDCFILFDDFLNRKKYHIVLKYFNIVKKTADNKMVVLKKKKNKTIPDKLIKKYELISL